MNLKLVSGLVLCGAFAVACGDSGSNTAGGPAGGNNNNGGGDEGGSTGVLSGGNPNTGGSGAEGGAPPEAPDCYDEGAAFIINPDAFAATSPVGQGLCTAQQLTDYKAACFAPGTMETCMTFTTANPECTACINGGDAAPFILPVLLTVDDQGTTFANSYGCQAYATDLPQCAVPAMSLVTCGLTACGECGDAEFNDCVNYAINAPAICGTEIDFPMECGPVIGAATLAPECDDPAVDGFDGAYFPIGDYFCGTPD